MAVLKNLPQCRSMLMEALTEEERKNRAVRNGIVNSVWKILEREVERLDLPFTVDGVKRSRVVSGYSIRFALSRTGKGKLDVDFTGLKRALGTALRRGDLEGATINVRQYGHGAVVSVILSDDLLSRKGIASAAPQTEPTMEIESEDDLTNLDALRAFAAEDVSQPIRSQGTTSRVRPEHKQKPLPGQEGYEGEEDEEADPFADEEPVIDPATGRIVQAVITTGRRAK